MQIRVLAASAAVALLLSGAAFAQQQPSAVQSDTAAPKMADKQATVTFKGGGPERTDVLASELTGAEVRNSAGENLGDINDIVLDQSGKPTIAVVGVGGFLNMGEKYVGVPFDQLKIAVDAKGKRVVQLDVTKQALESAPTYSISAAEAK